MNGITDIQRNTLRYLYWHHHDMGYAPTMRELQRVFGLKSLNAAFDRVECLERKGYATHVPRAARTLIVTEKGKQVLGQNNDPWPFFDVEKSA